ncbi:hypothetical protein V7075_24445, partial [Neobacillus drentensis]|uniref:hypothetical protein n=1 Tax=Neobacillus drentensis TaxID=220684 RepID=UPI002FFED58F
MLCIKPYILEKLTDSLVIMEKQFKEVRLVVVTHPTEYEVYLFHEGSLFESYKVFGAHSETQEGEKGTRFTVWAPRATQVHVV